MSAVITKTDHPAARKMPRKILSPVDGRATIARGMSSGTAGIIRVCASEGMAKSPGSFLQMASQRPRPANSYRRVGLVRFATVYGNRRVDEQRVKNPYLYDLDSRNYSRYGTKCPLPHCEILLHPSQVHQDSLPYRFMRPVETLGEFVITQRRRRVAPAELKSACPPPFGGGHAPGYLGRQDKDPHLESVRNP
jgi:hypothetical protein